MVLPVVEELRRKGVSVSVLALTTAYRSFQDKGFELLGFKDCLVDSPDPGQAVRWGELLVGGKSAHSAISYEESVAYHGLSFQDLVAEVGETEAFHQFSSKGRAAFLPIGVLTRLLRRYRPNVVLTTNSPRAERAAIEAAGHLDIKSVCVVDIFGIREIAWVGKKDYASRVCVMNESVRKRYLDAGRQPNELIVTGNPAFDVLINQRPIASKNRKIRASQNKLSVLWASQIEPDKHPKTGAPADSLLPRKIERLLIEELERNPNLSLVFRPHPSDQFEPEITKSRMRLSKFPETVSECLLNCDVVVTMTSTVAIEANVLGIPSVSIDLSAYTAEMPLAKFGISHGIKKLDHLWPTIYRVADEKTSFLASLEPATAKVGQVVLDLAAD